MPQPRLQGGFHKSHSLIRQGLYGNMPVARTVLQHPDPDTGSENPVKHGAVGIMVIGIHIAAPERAVLSDSVPVLPHGGGSPVYCKQPGRCLFLEQKLIGDIASSRLCQRMQQIGRSHKTGGKPHSVLLNHPDQSVRRRFPVVTQPEMEGQHISRLGSLNGNPLFHKTLLHGPNHILIQSFIFGHVPSENLSGLDKQ